VEESCARHALHIASPFHGSSSFTHLSMASPTSST
jgi:hypothetical protein